jgi:hypothetical protein
MPSENAVVAICNRAADVQATVAELRQQGLEPDCISIVAADGQSGSMPAAYYVDGGRLRSTATRGGSQSVVEPFAVCAVLVCPGERTLFLAGPFAASVVGMLHNEGLFGGLGPIAGGLYNLGFSRDEARDYELTALQGRPLVIVYGRARDVERARHVSAVRP